MSWLEVAIVLIELYKLKILHNLSNEWNFVQLVRICLRNSNSRIIRMFF